MNIKNWIDVVEIDFPEITINAETIQCSIGSVRVSTGRIWTDADFEARRTRVLNTPLP